MNPKTSRSVNGLFIEELERRAAPAAIVPPAAAPALTHADPKVPWTGQWWGYRSSGAYAGNAWWGHCDAASTGSASRSVDFQDCYPIRYDVLNVDSRSGSASSKEVLELVVGYAKYE